MGAVLKLRRSYLTALGECRALYRHSLAPRALHTEAGVEAAFLQMYKAWEALQEECTIAFLSGRLRADGRIVACGTRTKDEHVARTLLYQDRDYVLWTNVDEVVRRWIRIFGDPNVLVAAIRPATTELKQMATIRNVIAHSSVLAKRKFYDLIRGQIGGRPSINRAAGFLSSSYPPDPTRTFFDRYADVLELVGNGVTG